MTSEPLLRMLSGQPNKLVKIHLCDDPCSHLTWSKTVVHASRIKRDASSRIMNHAWSRNAEVSVREAERDEMEVLRREAAERGKGVGTARVAPGEAAAEAGDDRQEKVKEDSKKKKKKRKREKEKVQAVKTQEALYGSTPGK